MNRISIQAVLFDIKSPKLVYGKTFGASIKVPSGPGDFGVSLIAPVTLFASDVAVTTFEPAADC
ncbi:MAG: hypothetical protein LH472_09800, partial [Pyrinomonadaceae bacterium]|nr:hypothetical protein [Pyrinomonadaceae bacterium]